MAEVVDISLDLTDGIIATLRGDAAVKALVENRVFDDVPEDAAYPYIKVEIGPIHADLADNYEGYEIFPKLNIWSREIGSVEAKRILAASLSALTRAPIALANNSLLSLTRYIDDIETDSDGKTKKAVAMLRAIAEA